MRICLLTYQDLDAEPDLEGDFPCDPRPFLPDDDWHLEVLVPGQSPRKRIEARIAEGFDVFFNLCDGDGREYPGIDVVRMLEEHGVPFTGPTSACFDPTRLQMKQACRKARIATPKHVVVRDEADAHKALDKLRFPMIVKCYQSYASVDLSRHSRVSSAEGLTRQVRKMLTRHSAALVEEFIEGDECTVLVAETPGEPKRPTTYKPVQYRFPEGELFKHERLKWVDYEGLSAAPVEDAALDARLRDEAARFFVAIGGTGFARCDVRVARDGTPYMLEINPHCGVYFEEKDYGGADLCLSFDPAGHVGFTRQLVEVALARPRA